MLDEKQRAGKWVMVHVRCPMLTYAAKDKHSQQRLYAHKSMPTALELFTWLRYSCDVHVYNMLNNMPRRDAPVLHTPVTTHHVSTCQVVMLEVIMHAQNEAHRSPPRLTALTVPSLFTAPVPTSTSLQESRNKVVMVQTMHWPSNFNTTLYRHNSCQP